MNGENERQRPENLLRCTKAIWVYIHTVVPGREEEGSVDERELVEDGHRAATGDAGEASDAGGAESSHQHPAHVVVAVRAVVVQPDVVGVLRRAPDGAERRQVGAVLEDVAARRLLLLLLLLLLGCPGRSLLQRRRGRRARRRVSGRRSARTRDSGCRRIRSGRRRLGGRREEGGGARARRRQRRGRR